LVHRNWPDALDERKAIYKEFLTKVANISYKNLNQFLKFESDKSTVLPNTDYNNILEMVTKCMKLL
jgi:hypothetical protein